MKTDEVSIFAFMAVMAVELAITDDFEEDEIRCLNPRNPPNMSNIDTWDGILDKKEPIHADLGINKNKDIFYFQSDGKWRKI